MVMITDPCAPMPTMSMLLARGMVNDGLSWMPESKLSLVTLPSVLRRLIAYARVRQGLERVAVSWQEEASVPEIGSTDTDTMPLESADAPDTTKRRRAIRIT